MVIVSLIVDLNNDNWETLSSKMHVDKVNTKKKRSVSVPL